MTFLLLLLWDCALALALLALIAGGSFPLMACWLFLGILFGPDLIFYIAFSRFLRKSRPLNLLIAILTLKEILEITVLVLFCRIPGTSEYFMFMLLLAAYPFIQICRYAFKAPGDSELLPRLQIGALTIMLAWLVLRESSASVALLPLVLATVLLMTLMILSRTVGKDVATSHRASVVLTVLVSYALIAAAFAAALPLVRVPYEKAITALLSVFWKGLVFLFHYLSLALNFILSLFPAIPQRIPEITEETAEEIPQYTQEAAESNPFFAGLMVVLLLLLCIWLIYRKFRGQRLGRTPSLSSLGTEMQRGKWNVGHLLKDAFRQLAREIRLRILLYRKRNTNVGCYLWLVRRNRKTAYALKIQESPHAYLGRLAQADPSLQAAILSLQQGLDLEVYGGRKADPLPYPQIRKIWTEWMKKQKKKRL